MPNKKVRAWSSTNVRWMLATGRVKEAREILDQPHRVEGTVVHGDERGREIGFPTVNLGEKIEGYVPVDGVYAGWVVDLDADNKNDVRPSKNAVPDVSVLRRDELHLGVHSPWRWPAAISIGTKPTFNKDGEEDAERTVEAYGLFDDWKDLYGHRVCIEFASFLRPQQAFDSVDALKDMLKANVEQVREITDAEAEV